MEMIKQTDYKRILKMITISLGLITLVSALILIYMGSYASLALDDFDYGMNTYHLIQSGSYSFFDVVGVAIDKVIAMRDQWQGTYFGIFVMSLNPLFFDSSLGWLLPLTAIGSIFLGNICLFSWIKKQLQLDRMIQWSLIFAVTLITINTLPAMNEGMYWWISVSFYTFSYALVMGYFVLWMSLPRHRLVYSGLMLLLGFMLEGNCWPCCTLMIAFVILYCGYGFIRKFDRKDQLLYLFHALFLITCFLFALSAPGNFVRESVVAGVPAWIAIIESPFYALLHILVYLSPATLLICAIVGYELNRNRTVWAAYQSFFRSIWFLIGVVLLYSAMFAPTIYGENHVAAGRYLNVLYLLHLPVCLAITLFLIARYRSRFSIHVDKTMLLPGIILGAAFLFSGLFWGKYEDFASLTVLLDIRNGYADQYRYETRLRMEQLTNDEPIVTIPSRSVYPRLFMVDDGSTDWVNEDMSEYYSKQEIIIDATR